MLAHLDGLDMELRRGRNAAAVGSGDGCELGQFVQDLVPIDGIWVHQQRDVVSKSPSKSRGHSCLISRGADCLKMS
jgi:hypothetical protein